MQRLEQQSPLRVFVAPELRLQELQSQINIVGSSALAVAIAGPEHDAHATAAEDRLDDITATDYVAGLGQR